MSQAQLLSKRGSKARVDSLPSIDTQKNLSARNQLKRIFKHSEVLHIQPNSISVRQQKLHIDSSDQCGLEKQLTTSARKSPQATKYSSPQFFSRKMQFRNNSLVNLNQEVVNQIKGVMHKDVTLFQIVSRISHTMNQLNTYKSEKAILSAVDKLIKSHIRFQELEWLFQNLKLKDWQQTDVILLRLIQNFTINTDNKLTIKKNKPDPYFLQILFDFSEKLELLFKKLCDDSYRQLEDTIITQKQKLLDKEVEVMQQFSKQGKKESFNQFRLILEDQFKMNTRVMESKIMKQLTEFEDRFGAFKQIDSSHRFISSRINDLVYDLKKISLN